MTLKSTTAQKKQSKQSSFAWKPHAYQKKALKMMLDNDYLGLFLDPGLGKTSISLAAIQKLQKEKVAKRALVIAPLRPVYQVWPKEIEKWTNFSGLTAGILHGPRKENVLEEDYDIYLINPEGLAWLLGHPLFRRKFFNQILIVDESSKFKDVSTQRFKLLRPNLEMFSRRYILTGTPAPNGLLDLFGQIYILDLGASLGRFITHYKNKYFYPTGFNGYQHAIQPGKDVEIQEKIKPITLRLDAADYLDLPEMIICPTYVDLPPEARKHYDDMEDELVASIKAKDIVASNAAVATGKCAQIANGAIYDSERRIHHMHHMKTEAVQGIVEELNGSPVLVAYEYGHDLARLQKAFGKDVPYIGGGVSPKKAVAIEQEWNAGNIPVLLGQPASMAHGLNLQQAGNHIIWHSLTWNFEHYDQFNKRILRQGNTHSRVFVYLIIARDTIDEIKLYALNRKFKTQKDLFDALNNYLKKRKKL